MPPLTDPAVFENSTGIATFTTGTLTLQSPYVWTWESRVGPAHLTHFGVAVVLGIFGVYFAMNVFTNLWLFYRWRRLRAVKAKLQGMGRKWGKPLKFHSPDDTPRTFVQYSYTRSWVGNVIIYSWVVVPSVGYILMIPWTYVAYTVDIGWWFPPSVEFWRDLFGDWDGCVLPWCVNFTVVHAVGLAMSKLFGSMRSRSMLAVPFMRYATHVIINESNSVDLDAVPDPDSWLHKATKFLAGKYERATKTQVLPIVEENGLRMIEFTCVRYVYSEVNDCFVPRGEKKFTAQEAHAHLKRGGLTSAEAADSLAVCGPNEIHVHVQGVIEALMTEFLDFTYIFNSIGTWSYLVYSTWNIGAVWTVMIVGSGMYRALFIIRPNQKSIAKMAELHQDCEVLREGEWLRVDASNVTVGDIVLNEDGSDAKLPCDGIVVDGCLVVNESMLTGEPMPIAKAAVDDSERATIVDKLNKACAGTLSLESTGPHKGKSIMIATSIGALTTRGQLVRMVLFPASVRFKYNDQLPVVYAILCVYMLLLTVVNIFFVKLGSVVVTFLMVLNTVAMCLSPMLPVSMVMGQSVSAKRLEGSEYEIKCLQPGRIPIVGKVSTVVFDKTGTITKGCMDFAGAVSVEKARFGRKVEFDPNDPECEANRAEVAGVPTSLRHAIASCHTVRQLRDGSLVGNQVECAMVRTSGWQLGQGVLESPFGEVLSVVRKLEFDHHRMTSGVVVRTASGGFEVFVKGSYERIRELSRQTSRPPDYDEVTMGCAKDNYYTLGVATKSLPRGTRESDVAGMTRDDCEAALDVCGLLLFRNEMKPDSGQAIDELRGGGVRSVICTGDNEFTGIAIGRKCGIVETDRCLRGDLQCGVLVWTDPDDSTGAAVNPEADPCCQLAVTCSAWRYLLHEDDDLDQIWQRIVVFARMRPDDKINVVRYLQDRGLVVGMAGDGGNDCGGLRAAHAGLALSDAEASMVSPFSTGRLGEEEASKDITLRTLPDLIREGRACLASNLATFMYFMVYGFTLTTLRTVMAILRALSLGEWVWLTMDIGIGVVMMYFMTQSRAAERLSYFRPTATLLGVRTVCGILFPYLTAVAAEAAALAILWRQPWFDPLDPYRDIAVRPQDWSKKGDNYESPVTLLVLFTALVNTAYVNTYGGSFRRNVLRNWGINVTYIVIVSALFFMTLSTPNQLNCVYRVNCDTLQSLACASIPVLPLLSVGGVGGCFLGPQLKVWQGQTGQDTWGTAGYPGNVKLLIGQGRLDPKFWPPPGDLTAARVSACLDEPLPCLLPKWQPDSSRGCMPPLHTLALYPRDDAAITTGMGLKVASNCVGPNNCYSDEFKYCMAAIMTIYILVNHLFKKCVLLGPVAVYMRSRRPGRGLRGTTDEDWDDGTEDSDCSEDTDA